MRSWECRAVGGGCHASFGGCLRYQFPLLCRKVEIQPSTPKLDEHTPGVLPAFLDDKLAYYLPTPLQEFLPLPCPRTESVQLAPQLPCLRRLPGVPNGGKYQLTPVLDPYEQQTASVPGILRAGTHKAPCQFLARG